MYSFLLVKVDSLTRHLTEHRWRIVKVRKDRVRDEHLSGDCFRHQAHVMSWTPSSEEGIWLEATSPLWISHFPTSKSLSPECQCVHRSRLSRFPTFWDKLPIVRVQPWVNLPPLSLSREPNTWPVLLWKKEKLKKESISRIYQGLPVTLFISICSEFTVTHTMRTIVKQKCRPQLLARLDAMMHNKQ